MAQIIVAGSINMDVVVRVDALPSPGATVFGHDLQFIPGGKGSNQAIAASRYAAPQDGVRLVGRLGRDGFGETLLAYLRGERLDVQGVTLSDSLPTGTALITVDASSENTIVVVSGSNGEVGLADVDDLPMSAGDVCVSVFEIPQATIRAFFQRARAHGARTVLNPAPAVAFIPGLLKTVDYLVVNETELAFFAGADAASHDPQRIAQMARALRADPAQTVIVTLGAKGALAIHGDETTAIDGRRVPAVDTTGAGDCFVGVLAVALAEGHTLAQALRLANCAASLSVQKPGAATSMPHRADVLAVAAE